MSLFETLYFALHIPVIPAWGLLILAPRSALTSRYVHSGAIPLILGAAYGGFLMAGVFFGYSKDGAGMNSLGAVALLMSHPVGLLTGWAHFLIYDLFVGAWISRDSQRRGLSHMGSVPILLLALIFGPLGLMAHMIRRLMTGHSLGLSETADPIRPT